MTTTTPRPLTPLMVGVLRALATADRPPLTGNEIGYAVGVEVVRGGRGMGGRGRGSRVFGRAQRIIPCLVALRQRGLIELCGRRDGLSGTAYAITPEGRAALAETDAA